LRCFYINARDIRLMARFAQNRIGRRGVKPISACILTGIVRVLDFALLLIAAWLAAIGVGAWLGAPSRGLLALAAAIGAVTGCIGLSSQGAYAFDRLRFPRSQTWPILKAVLLAVCAVITCLFLVNAKMPPLRAFPFAFGANALLLLARLHQLRGLGDAKLLKSLVCSFKGRHYRG
jgi:hypothetical protein